MYPTAKVIDSRWSDEELNILFEDGPETVLVRNECVDTRAFDRAKQKGKRYIGKTREWIYRTIVDKVACETVFDYEKWRAERG